MATTGPNVRPGEKPPALSPEGLTKSRLGSDLFARYWMASLDWAYATTQSALARDLFAPSCDGCSRFLSNIIDSAKAKGEHFSGGRLTVSSSRVKVPDGHFGATAVVDLTVEQTQLKVLNRAGAIVETTPATTGAIFRHWLKWNNGHWVLVDWKHVVVK